MSVLLQINVTANSGSTGRIAEQIGLVAKSHGWESYIAYGRSANYSESSLIKIGSKFDIYFHGFLTRFFDIHGFGSKRATKKLINKIQKIKPDIIHLHNIHGYYINYPILFDYLKKSKIPVVWTLHDCWSFTGHCAHFSLINCNKWKIQCLNCPQKHLYPSSWLFDNSKSNYLIKKDCFNNIDNLTLVVVSKWINNLIEESFLDNKKVILIYNGVDLNIFKPKFRITRKKFLLLALATSWTDSKGLKDYYKLSKLLDYNRYQITLIGLSKMQINNLPDNIIGIERTSSQEELTDYYSNADVVLNFSYQESFGLTTVEGLACGTPVIVYNCTASPELVDEKTGIIVEPGDMDGVVKAIKTIEAKGKEYYSENCRKRAVENFDKDKQFEKYFELYEKLLKDKQ